MAASNGKLTNKQIEQWFNEQDFEQQRTVLSTLSASHDKGRAEKVSALRRELAALERRESSIGKKSKASSVSVKYRNPVTGETWSGRGRMASWLAAKQKSGEKITRYLVK